MEQGRGAQPCTRNLAFAGRLSRAESLLFFPPSLPERREDRDAREAKAKMICGDCSVQRDCLDFALRVREPHGIWGGLTEAERRRLIPDD